MTNTEMMKIVRSQLAVDYNCSPDDFVNDEVVFTVAKKLEGRREMYFSTPRLEIITMGRGVIVNASKDIMPYVKKQLVGKNKYELLNSHLVYGVNPYYLPDLNNIKAVENDKFDFELVDENIAGFYKYKGFKNALQYDSSSKRPEVLCATAMDKGKLVGIACASADSKTMWQIGVDVLPEYRGNGIAVKLVNMLTIETLNRGAVPYYTTDCGNIASQRVAVKSGYIPAWSHCFKTRVTNNPLKRIKY